MEACSCDPEAPTSADDCADPEVFVCLYGTFSGPDAVPLQAAYDCRCLPLDEFDRVLCSDHPRAPNNAGASILGADELWCGNCAIAGIR
jgi:hypothetical protein